MSSTRAYCIVESGTRGKIAVADRYIFPVEMVLKEEEPLLFFTHSFGAQNKFQWRGAEKILPVFHTFIHDLTPSKQRNLLSLFGPTNGTIAERIRIIATEEFSFHFPADAAPRSLTIDEVEMFVKVAAVSRFNMLGNEQYGYAIFGEVSRFNHSCDSNCENIYEAQTVSCYAKRYISAGEELSFSYAADRDIEPTHERRHKYMETKEFTCHCRRCDAPGDDTRQFDCADPACKGVMMVCQPINAKKFDLPYLAYTDVEYVEPHFLPCTVCHRSAPVGYQEKMLKLEVKLPSLVKLFWDQSRSILRNGGVGVDLFLQKLSDLNVPRRHYAALHLLRTEWQMLQLQCITHVDRLDKLKMLMREYLSTLESFFPNPHKLLLEELIYVIVYAVDLPSDFPATFSPQQEKELCQKTLRVNFILRGRNRRVEELDNKTAGVLKKLPPVVSTEMCAFCEESPKRAALTLSRCGRCKQVVYCSVGCQKAHWSLHKKTCKAQENT